MMKQLAPEALSDNVEPALAAVKLYQIAEDLAPLTKGGPAHGLAIATHGTNNSFSAALMRAACIPNGGQLTISGTPGQICEQLQDLRRRQLRVAISVAAFELHHFGKRTAEVLDALKELTRGAVIYADYTLLLASPLSARLATSSNEELRQKAQYGGEEPWLLAHRTDTPATLDASMRQSGIQHVHSLELPAHRAVAIGSNQPLPFAITTDNAKIVPPPEDETTFCY